MTDPDILPVPHRSKDPRSAARSRAYRARKKALVMRDATVTATGTAMIPVDPVTSTVTDVTVMSPSRMQHGSRFLAGVLIITGFALGGCGLILNFQFGASLGRTPTAAMLLGGIGLGLDILAMLLPGTAAALWDRGRRQLALVAWCLWPCVLVMTLLAATGFAAGNLGDSIAGRERDAAATVNSRAELERLRGERATIAEARSTGEIEAAESRVRVPDWARPCDKAEARARCSGLLALRSAEATAKRRDALDAHISAAEAKLTGLPAVGLADPTGFAAELVTWITAGRIAPTAADVFKIRIIGLTVAPSAAGLVLMFAAGLIGGRRQ